MITGLHQLTGVDWALLLSSLVVVTLTIGLSSLFKPKAPRTGARWALLGQICGLTLGLWLALVLSTVGFSSQLGLAAHSPWLIASVLATCLTAISFCSLINTTTPETKWRFVTNTVILGLSLNVCHWLVIAGLIGITAPLLHAPSLWLGPLLAIGGVTGWLIVIQRTRTTTPPLFLIMLMASLAAILVEFFVITNLGWLSSKALSQNDWLHYLEPIIITCTLILNALWFFIQKAAVSPNYRDLLLLQALFNNTSEGIAVSDAAGCLVKTNYVLNKIITTTKVTGPFADSKVIPNDVTADMLAALLKRVAAGENIEQYELALTQLHSQRHLYFSIHSSILMDEQQNKVGAVLLLRETTVLHEQGNYEKTTTYLSTKLPDEHELELVLDKALKEAPTLEGLSLISINLDDFKAVVYNYGFGIANNLLNKVADRLDKFLRNTQPGMIIGEQSFLAHVDGDQFAIMLSGTNEKTKIASWSQQILEMFNSPFILNDKNYYLHASIGIANYPESGKTSSDLLASGQIALFRAKQLGKNNFQFFSPEIRLLYHRQTQLRNDLDAALQQSQFTLVYQPQQKMDTHALRGFEVLIRWHHPTLGEISPDEFIPLAEKSNLITRLDAWVLDKALTQLHDWQESGILAPEIKLAINISASQLANNKFPDILSRLLSTHHIQSQSLELEITETALITTSEQIPKTIKWLQQQDISLSLDDFGTGYSSLSRIKDLPINILKIDKSFIRPILTDVLDQEITKTILALSKSLYLQVVAEGVESVEQVIYLAELSCDYGQGFYFAKPLDAATVPAFVKTLLTNSK